MPDPSKRYLKDFEPGETFTGFYVLRSRELRTRRDGQPYLVLEFGDRSGRLFGNIWDDAEKLFNELDEGGVVKLRGRIEIYRDARQINVQQLRRAKDGEEYDLADLLPTTDIDVEAGFRRIRGWVDGIRNPHLKALLEGLLDDDDFAARFKKAPAGKLWHHNRIGGLLEHTLSMCRLCRILGRFYPEADRDLLLAGAILHDAGKVEEYRYDTVIDYTDRGRLVGHITIGAEMAGRCADEIEGFPPDLRDRLQHLILSHQGSPETGSPSKPATREAFLLHYADEIDSKMDALRRIAADAPEGERWRFVKLLERHIDVSSSNNQDGEE